MEEIEFGAPSFEKGDSLLFRMLRSRITQRVLIGTLVLVFLAQSSQDDYANLETSKSVVTFKYNGRILYAEKIGNTIIIFDPTNANDADSDRAPYGGGGEGDDVRFPGLYADRFSSLSAQHPEFVRDSEIPTLARK